jgi:hypothetical protein
MRKYIPAFLLTVLVAVDCCVADTIPEGAEQLGGYYQLRSWQVELKNEGFTEKTKQRLTILNPRGDKLANLTVSSSQFYTLGGLRMDVFDSQGRKMYSKKEGDWGKACGFGPAYALYSDVCFRYIQANGPGYPYTIEWEAEWNSNSLFFWSSADFQQDVPVVQAVYELKSPSDLAFQYKAYGLEIEPEVNIEGNRSVYRWTAIDIPAHALQGDGFLTPEYKDYGRVVFSPESFRLGEYQCSGRSWDAIAAWYRDMAQDRYLEATPAADSVSDSALVRQLIGTIYHSVIENNRYVAVSIGVGGWQPHAASVTEQNAYGDCKDLTTLLVSRLRNYGFDAYPALLLTRSAGLVDSSFPSGRFNHVITMVPLGNDTIWMDPTCDICSFGDLPINDEDIFVLAVADDRGALVRTPVSQVTDNRLGRKTRIHISDKFVPNYTSVWTASGNTAMNLEGFLRHSDDEERVEILKERMSRSSRSWSVVLQQFEREQTGDRNLRLELVGGSEKPLLALSAGFVLTPFCFSPAMPQEDLDLTKRVLPVDLGFPRQVVDTVVVTWARQLILDSIIAPKDSTCAYALGSCSVSMQMFKDSAVAVLTNRVEAYELPVSEFASFRSFCLARNRLAEACFHFRLKKPGE